MRDRLPKESRQDGCGILNFDGTGGSGMHWTAWYKNKNDKVYFLSVGIQPPNELGKYLKSPIYYNSKRLQPEGEVFVVTYAYMCEIS